MWRIRPLLVAAMGHTSGWFLFRLAQDTAHRTRHAPGVTPGETNGTQPVIGLHRPKTGRRGAGAGRACDNPLHGGVPGDLVPALSGPDAPRAVAHRRVSLRQGT